MRQALEGNYRAGLKIGLGASTMDTIYSMIAVFASSAFVLSLKDLFTLNPWLLLTFQVLCIGTLVVLSLRYFKATTVQVAATEQKEMAQEERVHKMGLQSNYLLGIWMSITNLASPTFIPSLIAVASFMHAKNLVDNSVAESVCYAIGFGAGAAGWFLVVLRTVYRLRSRLSAGFISRLYRFAAWSFVVFAIILTVNVVIGLLR